MNFRTESVVRVLGACAVGGVMVAVALWFEPSPRAPESSTAAVVVAHGNARATISDRSDAWRRTLPEQRASAEPIDHTEDIGPYERPETLTGQLSEQLLERSIRERMSGGMLTPDSRDHIVASSMASIERETRERLYSRADVHNVNPSGLAAYREYGNAVSRALSRNSIQNEHEMLILQRAVTHDDPSQLQPLAAIERAYGGMIDDLLRIPTPSDLSRQHVDLINTLVTLKSDIGAMRQVFDDPLKALVHVQRYTNDATGLFFALTNIAIALEERGVAYTNDEPGIFLFSLQP